MKFSEIVAMAKTHTEARGSKVLDYNAELWAAIIDFCTYRTWRWRRKTGTFDTVPSQPQYDLVAVLSAGDLEEIEAVIWVPAQDGLKPVNLDEITDAIEQAVEIESDVEGDPHGWFRLPGNDLTLVIRDTTANAERIRVVWRSVPAPATFAAPGDDKVPLVPSHLHPTLVKCLEVRILHYSIGDEDPKFEAAKGERDEMIAKAVMLETT
jgi:hypothetical protein